MVGVNVPIPVPMAFFSFGGWKQSLFGDLHVHGLEGIKFYTRTKAITTRWPATRRGRPPASTCRRRDDHDQRGARQARRVSMAKKELCVLRVRCVDRCASSVSFRFVRRLPIRRQKACGAVRSTRSSIKKTQASVRSAGVIWCSSPRPSRGRAPTIRRSIGLSGANAPTARRWRSATRSPRTPTTTRGTAACSSWRPICGITWKGAYIDEVMRVYLYDDYTRPLSPELRSGVTGRIVTKETFDPKTRTTKEITVFPLKVSADGEYLEARVGRMKFPAEMTAKLRFTRAATNTASTSRSPSPRSTRAAAAVGGCRCSKCLTMRCKCGGCSSSASRISASW